ncbi:hypothetical protein C3L29_011030 [Pseudomonas sp. MWU12-2534b]|uniref:hypothetical protein n=1 Tax=Pseudomonas chlororaphis TaxID=587753 RepID=UPI000DE02CDE|nr:hypothetical protein [Pseudomonas chlororaphis]MCO7613722.1 hypothetical protein [Pseudomonas chlororaphis]RBJ83670.1 hypothetical protein C3L29_011030 [Pseudomonas sp. MWU12-2534b]
MQDPKPSSMRFWEAAEKEKNKKKANGTYIPAIFEGVELHQKYDQERYRFAQLPFRSQFWLFMQGGGGWIFIILAPFTIIANLAIASVSIDSWWDTTSELLFGFYPALLGPPLLCWLIGYIVINHFPRIWFRPPKGPLWELNRRTGLVTFFDYKRFKKEGVIDEVVAPFYEFDAYIVTSPDRQGSPMNGLFLIHRYRDIRINFNSLITPDNTLQKPCALWDFFQNFMDISRPLPDIPLYEPYRHLDPVTAEYDRQQQRPARYWIDMDDETFKAKVKEMLGKIDAIDTFNRPNLMANHVQYID